MFPPFKSLANALLNRGGATDGALACGSAAAWIDIDGARAPLSIDMVEGLSAPAGPLGPRVGRLGLMGRRQAAAEIVVDAACIDAEGRRGLRIVSMRRRNDLTDAELAVVDRIVAADAQAVDAQADLWGAIDAWEDDRDDDAIEADGWGRDA